MGYFSDRNQWALILGGSSGLGYASAVKMASEGMNLLIVHRDRKSSMEKIEQKFQDLRNHNILLETRNMDAINQDKMQELINELLLLNPNFKVKLLLHSIAKGNLKPISKDSGLTHSDFMLTVESMGISLFSWAKALLDQGLFDQDARIISFTSEGSTRSFPHYAAVSAAKSTLESISRSLALELAPYDIKSNCIQAGTTNTNALNMIPGNEQLKSYSIQRNPYKRLTNPEDVANVVFVMTMDETSWINGAIIPVNGGEHLQ